MVMDRKYGETASSTSERLRPCSPRSCSIRRIFDAASSGLTFKPNQPSPYSQGRAAFAAKPDRQLGLSRFWIAPDVLKVNETRHGSCCDHRAIAAASP